MAIVPATSVTYIGNGSTKVFQVPFEYLDKEDVYVEVAGSPYTHYTWELGRLSLEAAPAKGAYVKIYRSTPAESMDYVFQSNAPFLPVYVDADYRQLLFSIQELASSLQETKDALEAADTYTVRALDKLEPIPSTEAQRAGKLLAFNSQGNPVTVVADSGSGTELAVALAQSDGASFIGYHHTTLQAALDNTRVSVKDWGAKGDGVTDDTVAKDRAYEYARQLGAKLFFPAGTYILSTGISQDDGVQVVGAGIGQTCLKLSDDADVNVCMFTNANNTANTINREDGNLTPNLWVGVSDMEIDGNVKRLADATYTVALGETSLDPHAIYTTTVEVDGLVVNGRISLELENPRFDVSVRAECYTAGTATLMLTNNSDVPIMIDAQNMYARTYSYKFAGYTRGTGIGYAGVNGALISNVYVHDWAKHCISVDASVYDLGDAGGTDETAYPRNPSRFVLIQNSYAARCGDDCITTHGIEFVKIYNCHTFDPQGTYIEGNSNGFEIDDNSRLCILDGVSSIGGSSGIQIKAHQTHPAASRTILTNFFFDHTDCGIDLHHTYHGDTGQEVSPTGRNVIISQGMVRYSPRQFMRSLSYHNVSISDLTFIDDGRCTFNKPFAVENGSQNVMVSNIRMIGFPNTTTVLYIQASTTSNIKVHDCYLEGGTKYGVYLGTAVSNIDLKNIHLKTDNAEDGAFAIYSGSYLSTNNISIENVTKEGWPKHLHAGGDELTDEVAKIIPKKGMGVGGDVYFGTGLFESPNDVNNLQEGWLFKDGYQAIGSRDNGTVLFLNRNGEYSNEATTNQILTFQRNGVSIGSVSIAPDGSSVNYNSTSDKNLKDDLGEYSYDDARALIDKVQLHKFQWKLTGVESQGVFAQELHEVFPCAVSAGGLVTRDEEDKLARDSGSSDTGNSEYIPWTVDYQRLIVPMLATIKGLADKVDALENKLNDQESS